MAIESYRHRFDDAPNLSPEWYLDDVQVEQVYAMLENKELTSKKIKDIQVSLNAQLRLSLQKPEELRDAQDIVKIEKIKEAREHVARYAKNEDEPIDLGDEAH